MQEYWQGFNWTEHLNFCSRRVGFRINYRENTAVLPVAKKVVGLEMTREKQEILSVF